MSLPASAVPPPLNINEPANAARQSAETLELLARRRSTKIAHMVEPGPNGEQIEALLQLAMRVPDHGKLGPWRFIIIEGDARARAGALLARVLEDDNDADAEKLAAVRSHFLRAPMCVIVVSTAAEHAKIPEWEQQMSAGAAGFSLLLGAHAMGFAGCWLTEWPAYDGRARKALGLNEEERVAGFVYLGSTRETATERVRAETPTRISRF